jgi:hypothetical protein
MIIADMTNTVGLVLLKNRNGWIFILDSMEEVLVGNRINNEDFIITISEKIRKINFSPFFNRSA